MLLLLLLLNSAFVSFVFLSINETDVGIEYVERTKGLAVKFNDFGINGFVWESHANKIVHTNIFINNSIHIRAS